jgi:hypothetical protein
MFIFRDGLENKVFWVIYSIEGVSMWAFKAEGKGQSKIRLSTENN